MKKTRGFLFTAGLVLAMAFTFLCSCGGGYRRGLPPDLIKIYHETLDVPDVSAEDLFKKIRLYFITVLDAKYFEDTFERTLGTSECTKTASFELKIKDAFDEGKNSIVFKPKRELAGPFTEKPRVAPITVFANPGQYSITGIYDAVYVTRDAKRDELEKVLNESLPEVEGHWKSFIAEMKQVITERIITEQITDEEFEKLMQSGHLEFQEQMSKHPQNISFAKYYAISLKAATARPDNARALYNYGLFFFNAGAKVAAERRAAGIRPPKDALNYFNRALYIFELAPRGNPEVDQKIKEAVSETLKQRRQAEQEVYRAGSLYCH